MLYRANGYRLSQEIERSLGIGLPSPLVAEEIASYGNVVIVVVVGRWQFEGENYRCREMGVESPF